MQQLTLNTQIIM